MKYFKQRKSNSLKLLLIIFSLSILLLFIVNKDIIKRSLITVSLGSFNVELINLKAEIINYINSNNLKRLSISMSPNNFVKMQNERSKMVSNFIMNGTLWKGQNNYFNSEIFDGRNYIKSKLKLFGMNPDHFRDYNAHSFRVKFNAGETYGKKKVNFLNPRSRDFITDPLMNMIYAKIYNGLRINYEPYQVKLNKVNYGILLKEDFFDKYLIEENSKRESVIFEIQNDSLIFNYLGEDNNFSDLAFQLTNEYKLNYDHFLDKIDSEKLESIILLSLIVNDNHPLNNINMHWYFNPVNGKIEPTYREGFVKKIENVNIDSLISNNKLILDIYDKKIKNNFLNNIYEKLDVIESFIKNDTSYYSFKNKMIGFKKEVNKRENNILNNIEFLKKNLFETKHKPYSDSKIRISKDTVIKGTFIVNKNQTLKINKGVKITLSDAYIKIYGSFEAIGSEKYPIKILGDNRSGTIFFNTKSQIIIDNVIFENLTNLNSNYSQPASITFYECYDIKITDSKFKNNINGDDYINFFRSNNIVLKNLKYENILYDAIDSDFSNLEISNSSFSNVGNDAVDGSGSVISLYGNTFNLVKDKAISAGEKSTFLTNNNIFSNNEIALVSKDGSKLISEKNILLNNKLDLATFVKKKFYGQPSIIIDSKVNNYLIEKNTNVIGLDSINFSEEVESKLYGNLYGKASE